jgi:hypothetical protein
MSNVVDLPKRERLIWTCGHCGCSTFYLYNDQTCECAGCENISDAGEWVTPIESKPRSPEKDNAGSLSVIAIGNVNFAKRNVLKKIAARSDEIALVAGWFEDGSSTSWCGAETEEQRDWAIRKLNELAGFIANKPTVETEE